MLHDLGFQRHGNERLYNGRTGEPFSNLIFIGPVYYQRLKHMVDDKIHARARGPMSMLGASSASLSLTALSLTRARPSASLYAILSVAAHACPPTHRTTHLPPPLTDPQSASRWKGEGSMVACAWGRWSAIASSRTARRGS